MKLDLSPLWKNIQRVFENRIQRRTFGHKREEVTGDCRKLCNEELHNLCSSPGITQVVN
jgi:hypothetical protein